MAPWVWTFIENLAANWTAELFGPTTLIAWLIALGFAVYFVIRWHQNQRIAKKRGMASWQFIIICCAVAAIAIAFGAYGLGLKFGSQPEPIAIVSPPATEPPKEPTPPSPKPQRKYSNADLPKLTPVIQRISEVVASEGAPLATEIYKYCTASVIRQKLNTLGTQETIRQLREFAERANKFGAEIDTIQDEAGYYQEEVNYIIDAKQGNLAQTVASEIRNSTQWIPGIVTPLDMPSQRILGIMAAQLQSRASDFYKWAVATPMRIQEIRKDLNEAR